MKNRHFTSTFSRRSLLSKGGSILAASALIPTSVLAREGARSANHSDLIASLNAGEPTSHSVILQSRISQQLPEPGNPPGDSLGVAGQIRFEIATNENFNPVLIMSDAINVTADNDFIAKALIQQLQADTDYFYRVTFNTTDNEVFTSIDNGAFKTLPQPQAVTPVSFAIFSCMNYELFYGIGKSKQAELFPWVRPAIGEDRQRGYPAMDVLTQKNVDFIVATGDTVYYDAPNAEPEKWARTPLQMRQKWHQQFAVPSVRDALSQHAIFWMKDDHDFRFDDGDNSGDESPLPADGRNIFLEQVPAPQGDDELFRTHRLNKNVQLWFLEGRDYRSANDESDGLDKSIWGQKQRQWLQRTLLGSSAEFKIIISPSPLIGPDDVWKKDNHTSTRGFKTEGESFLNFLKDNDLAKSTFIICGDRHWQYHSIHPTGVEEFSCGAVHVQNARRGVAPGDRLGTDPNADILQPYLQPKPIGGFIQVEVLPALEDETVSLGVKFWAESGELLYAVRRYANLPSYKFGIKKAAVGLKSLFGK